MRQYNNTTSQPTHQANTTTSTAPEPAKKKRKLGRSAKDNAPKVVEGDEEDSATGEDEPEPAEKSEVVKEKTVPAAETSKETEKAVAAEEDED